MNFKLVCTIALEGYNVGDEITDADEIARIVAEGKEAYFVRVAVP